jgi:hypothetical protein
MQALLLQSYQYFQMASARLRFFSGFQYSWICEDTRKKERCYKANMQLDCNKPLGRGVVARNNCEDKG